MSSPNRLDSGDAVRGFASIVVLFFHFVAGDFLSLEKLESGQLKVSKSTINLCELMDEINEEDDIVSEAADPCHCRHSNDE